MIKLDQAKKVIEAAKNKAVEIERMMNIAVVDRGGNLVAFDRMDKAWMGGIEIAIDKAWTANAFDMPTQEMGKIAQPVEDNICFGIHTANRGRIIIFGGGVPIKKDDEIIGAIGVVGGYADEHDHPVALAGAAAL